MCRCIGRICSGSFFLQAEDGIRDLTVNGVQTCALPILPAPLPNKTETLFELRLATARSCWTSPLKSPTATETGKLPTPSLFAALKLPAPSPNNIDKIGRASCRERV